MGEFYTEKWRWVCCCMLVHMCACVRGVWLGVCACMPVWFSACACVCVGFGWVQVRACQCGLVHVRVCVGCGWVCVSACQCGLGHVRVCVG